MSRPPTLNELREAHAAESEQISKRIANGDDFPEAGRVWRALEKKRSSKPYIAAMTALNIPMSDGTSADWHSHALCSMQAWSWSCDHFDTTHLIGMTGVYDATSILRHYAQETPEGTLAASYERAVFDLLYHFAMVSKPVPNIQYKDIDDAIDAEQIKRWIETCEMLPEFRKATMLDWFKYSDLPESFFANRGK